MKSSTLKRIWRIVAALWAAMFWQFLAVPVIYFMLTQPISPSYYEPPVKFEEWAVYTQPDATFTQAFWILTVTQLLGLIATGVLILIIWSAYKLVKYIWYGPQEEEPVMEYEPGDVEAEVHSNCTDPACPCAWHKGEVFNHETNTWEDKECTDPDCPCVDHEGMKFEVAKNEWVEA